MKFFKILLVILLLKRSVEESYFHEYSRPLFRNKISDFSLVRTVVFYLFFLFLKIKNILFEKLLVELIFEIITSIRLVVQSKFLPNFLPLVSPSSNSFFLLILKSYIQSDFFIKNLALIFVNFLINFVNHFYALNKI